MKHDPRLLAVRILSTWVEKNDPPRIESRDSPQWQALSPRDRALAFDLICGVIRRRLTLDALIRAVSKTTLNKIEPNIMAILRIGVYQLIVAQGIADHAAIDTSVELVRVLGAPRAAGFVNAVLRNIQRLGGAVEPLQSPSALAFPLDDQRQVKFRRVIFPDPRRQYVEHLTATTSHPRELVSAMIRWIGREKTRQVLIVNNVPPVVTLRSDHPDFVPPSEAGLMAHQSEHFFVAAKGWNPTIEALIAQGQLSPQDPTSARTVQAMVVTLQLRKPNAGKLNILDLCAGLGTKAIQLARALPQSQIIACDIATDKLAALERRAAQTKVTNILVMNIHALHQQNPGIFDAVLVDAPCSNTGVLGRRLQARWRWPEFNSGNVRSQQLGILADAATQLHQEGLLVYSTCSIDPDENKGVVEQFLRDRPDESWDVIHQNSQLPTAGAAEQRCDGGFVTVFKRHKA